MGCSPCLPTLILGGLYVTCWAVNKSSGIILGWNRCTNYSTFKWRKQWGQSKFIQNLCNFYAYRSKFFLLLISNWISMNFPLCSCCVFLIFKSHNFIHDSFYYAGHILQEKSFHVQTSFLFKSVAWDNLWAIFIRWFHPLSVFVYGRDTWKVCKICFEWLTLKGGVCVGIAKKDMFLVMAFTEIYLFKFPRPDLFLVVCDFFHSWLEFKR